jgi:hypothetical protein
LSTIGGSAVTVVDTDPPVISSCPQDITEQVSSSDASSVAVEWTPPTATDNRGTPVLTSTRSPGDMFNITEFGQRGEVVRYTATDASGLTSECKGAEMSLSLSLFLSLSLSLSFSLLYVFECS